MIQQIINISGIILWECDCFINPPYSSWKVRKTGESFWEPSVKFEKPKCITEVICFLIIISHHNQFSCLINKSVTMRKIVIEDGRTILNKTCTLSFWQTYKCKYNEIINEKYLWEVAEMSVTSPFSRFSFKNAKKITIYSFW